MLKSTEWSKVPNIVVDLFARAITDRKFPVLLFGKTGTGKTSAAACLYASWPNTVAWFCADSTVRMIGECRSAQQTRGMTTYVHRDGHSYEFWEANFWAAVEQRSLIVLDDVLKRVEGLSVEVVCEVLDRRVGRPTVLTCNLSPNEMVAKGLDERLISRLLAGVPIDCGEEDRR